MSRQFKSLPIFRRVSTAVRIGSARGCDSWARPMARYRVVRLMSDTRVVC
jgi:hypothetical protein